METETTSIRVQFLYVEGELTLLDKLVVKLVPSSQCCKFWTGKFRNWTEIQAIDSNTKDVADPKGAAHRSQGCRRSFLKGFEIHLFAIT
jgi:hypothetical protein